MDRETITEIITAFGGLTPMSQATGLGITTIFQWEKRGNIPDWRHDAIIKVARKKKITLPPSFMEETTA